MNKLTLTAALFSSMFINNVVADEGAIFDLLAGVEAGIDTETAMNEADLTHTQYVLNYHPVGVGYSWYNQNTETMFRINVKKKYFLQDQQFCAIYNLKITHSEHSADKNLRACQNGQGKWIALIKEAQASSLIITH